MSLVRAFSLDLLFYGTSKGLVAITWIGTIALLTAHLAPADYSVFWQMFTLITGFSTIATTGLVTAFRRYYGQFADNCQSALYQRAAYAASFRTLAVSTALFLPTFLGCAWLAAWDLSILILAIASLAFIAAASFLLYCGQLMALRHTRTYLLANTGQALLFMGLVLVLLPLSGNHGIAIALALLLVSYLITAPAFGKSRASTGTSRQYRSESRRWEMEFFRFGLPLAIMNAAQLLGNLGTQVAISNIASTEQAGYYAAYSAPVERLVGFASSIAAMAFLPIISKHWDQERYREVLRFLGLVLGAVSLIAVLISVALIVFNQSLLGLIINQRYAAGGSLLPILCAATVISAMSGILADILILQKRTLQLALIFLGSSIGGMVLSIALTVVDGAYGAAVGRFVGATMAAISIAMAIRYNFRARSDTQRSTINSVK